MEKVQAHLWLSGQPRCSGPLCGKVVKNLDHAVFLIRNSVTLTFCCPECYFTASQLHLEQRRASQEVKNRDLLTSMGYTIGDGASEETG